MPHRRMSVISLMVLKAALMTSAIPVAAHSDEFNVPPQLAPQEAIATHWTPLGDMGAPGRREGGGTR